MLIDWFTVAAQAVNFLILVWLLKRFLYKPVLNAVDAREKLIAAELADAAGKKTEAQKESDEFRKKNEEFDQQRAALLSKATDDAKAEQGRLLDEARKAADALSAKRQQALLEDGRNLTQAIGRRTRQEVFAITRKALTDLATVSLEERLGEVFTRRLREMDGKAKESLAAALKTAADPSVVRSTFDLPAEQRAAVQNALNETFSAEVRIRFETSPDLISGIELTANGQKSGLEHCGLSDVDGKRRGRVAAPMTGAAESLQSVFDRAFAEIDRAQKAFAPEFVAHETGTITSVSTGIATVSGLPGAGFEELLEFPGGVSGIAFNVDENEIGVVLLGEYSTTCRRAMKSSERAGWWMSRSAMGCWGV